jgi:putative PEP-CTERM system histidine kinase
MLSVVTYGFAALSLVAATLVSVFKVGRRSGVRRVSIATITGAVWAVVLALSPAAIDHLSWPVVIAEAARYSALFIALPALSSAKLPRWLARSAIGLCVAPLLAVLARWSIPEWGLSAPAAERLLGVCGVLLAVGGLVFIEHLVRNAPARDARAVRLAAIGLGGQFAYDLFLNSQAELLGGMDPAAWAFRGVVVALLVVPLILGVVKLPARESGLFVSRQVVFVTSTLMAVGVYLSVMAIGGYYVRESGGGWGDAFQVLFLFGAFAVLVSLLLTESPLRRLRVFIATHFYSNKYDYRIEWLRFVQTLSSLEEGGDLRRAAIRAATQIFASPGGVLFLQDEEDGPFYLQAAWPEELGTVSRTVTVGKDEDLPRFMLRRQWVIDLHELRKYPERYENLLLPPLLASGGAWRLVTPLLVRARLTGFLVLQAPPEPFVMTFEDRDLLKTVGRHVAVQLAQWQAHEKLAESRQFDAYNRFTAFVMHDLKNSAAQLNLLVSNAARHRDNPEFFDDAISTISNASERIARLIEQLQSRSTVGNAREVDVSELCRGAVSRSQARQPPVTLDEIAPGAIVRADPDRLGSILDHIIRNAQDATRADGSIVLKLQTTTQHAQIAVTDNGFGMDGDFMRNRLFRPFDTTKGTKGMGIGAYQVREYVRSLGGDVEVQSAPGHGTSFFIRVPLCPTKSRAS